MLSSSSTYTVPSQQCTSLNFASSSLETFLLVDLKGGRVILPTELLGENERNRENLGRRSEDVSWPRMKGKSN